MTLSSAQSQLSLDCGTNQWRVDHGREFYLSLAVQESLSHMRRNTQRRPVVQTMSTENYKVERIWPEVNTRVNYPLKLCLNELVDAEILDMEDPLHKFATSVVTMATAETGMNVFVSAWNSHRIPGKGKPNEVAMENDHTAAINQDLLPTTEQAVAYYEGVLGGHLTPPRVFGEDLLHRTPALQLQRDELWLRHAPSMDDMFASVHHDHGRLFKDRVLAFIELTQDIALHVA